MHWLEQLAELYCAEDLPLFHDEVYSEIELSLSRSGELLGARRGRLRTLIPVTELSATRTNAVQPHPLSDILGYVAADYREDSVADSRYEQGSAAYLSRLGAWAGSRYATSELRAVYGCLSRRRLFADLMQTDVPSHYARGGMGKAVVRFVVDGVKLWTDRAVQDSHIHYMRSLSDGDAVCCLSGEQSAAARLHPRRIMSAASSAKLISAGMLPIGCETSFRAHAVLRRLIAEHGIHIGRKVFVAWDGAGRTSDMRGDVTVLVLHEVCRGNLAVSLVGQTDCARYMQFADSISDCCGDEALNARQRLCRELAAGEAGRI